MNRLIFDQLPVEIRMMVFDHLVSSKTILGKLCLTSYNWKTITQNSYAWKLWIKSLLGKKRSQKWANALCWPNIYIWNPVFNVQFAPENQVSNRVKNLLFKKFVYMFKSEGVQDKRFEPRGWFRILSKVGNFKSLLLLWNRYSLDVEDVIFSNDYTLLELCAICNLEALQWVYYNFYANDINNIQICHNCISGNSECEDRICDNCKFREALYSACENNNMAGAEWLYNTLNYDLISIRNDVTFTFAKICGCGYLPMAKWMHLTFGLTMDNIHGEGFCAVVASCKFNQLEVLQWLYTTFNFTLNDMRNLENSALFHACQGGYVNIVRWLCSTFEYTIDDARNAYENIFDAAMLKGNLEIVQILHSTVHFIYYDDVILRHYYALNMACSHKDPALVQWLCNTFQVMEIDIIHYDALEHASKNGCLAVIQWLCSNFSTTLTNIVDEKLLNTACIHGHLDIVQWLCTTIHPTLDDINVAISEALNNKHLSIAAWLRTKYNIIGDTRSYVKCMFHHACISDNLVLTTLLYSIGLFTIDEIRENENELLSLICEKGHLSIIRWLCSVFKLTSEDFTSGNKCPLTTAWINGNQYLACWLRVKFNIKINDMCNPKQWSRTKYCAKYNLYGRDMEII